MPLGSTLTLIFFVSITEIPVMHLLEVQCNPFNLLETDISYNNKLRLRNGKMVGIPSKRFRVLLTHQYYNYKFNVDKISASRVLKLMQTILTPKLWQYWKSISTNAANWQ